MNREAALPAAAPFLRPALAGAAATFSGIGLARFAYVPLFPAMVAAGWTSGAEAGFLGAVNLAGYLGGVLGGRAVARRLTTPLALDIGMGLTAAAFAACAWNGGLGWLSLWRGLAGLSGGILMALVGPAVQAAVSPSARGSAGGIVMTGVGSGVIAGSLAIPALLPTGLPATWLGLAAATLLLWAYAHPRWPGRVAPPPQTASPRTNAAALYVLYGLSGAAMVPHFVYFVDLAVRGRGLAPGLGAAVWLLFGAGAALGTIVGGRAADRLGAVSALRLWLVLQTAGVALTVLPGTLPLAPAALLGGFGHVGITPIVMTRARELAGPEGGLVWVRATAIFAVTQAVTGFAMAALFGAAGSHEVLFGVGAGLSFAALASSLWRA